MRSPCRHCGHTQTAVSRKGVSASWTLTLPLPRMDEKPEEHLAFQFAPFYASLQQAFEAIFERARSQRVIFVIDEFPYLAKADPSVSSILQALIDRASADSKLLLLLCGLRCRS